MPRNWNIELLECSALFQVVDGAYNGAKLSFTDQAVLTDNGLDKNSGYSVPLEIMPSGTKLLFLFNLYVTCNWK